MDELPAAASSAIRMSYAARIREEGSQAYLAMARIERRGLPELH
jgi:hypothetical protein